MNTMTEINTESVSSAYKAQADTKKNLYIEIEL